MPTLQRLVAVCAVACWLVCCSGASAPAPAPAPARPPGPPLAVVTPAAPAAQAAASAPTPTPPADDRQPSKVARRFGLLNGRLTAVLPAGSHQQEESDDSPSPDPGVAGSNSWHIVPVGTGEVTITSFELFAPVEADFERQVREAVARQEDPPAGYRLEPVAARAPLRVLRMIPTPPQVSGVSRELVLACLLYVAHPDGTVQAIELHSAPDAAVTTTELATQIGESLEAGPLALPRSAGPRTVTAWSARITGEVPDGFVTAVEPGMDYIVVSFIALAPIATRARTLSLTVSPMGPPSHEGRPVRGRLFGQATTLYAESSRGMRRLHGGVEDDYGAITVDMAAPTAEGLAVLRTIADGLRYVRTEPPEE